MKKQPYTKQNSENLVDLTSNTDWTEVYAIKIIWIMMVLVKTLKGWLKLYLLHIFVVFKSCLNWFKFSCTSICYRAKLIISVASVAYINVTWTLTDNCLIGNHIKSPFFILTLFCYICKAMEFMTHFNITSILNDSKTELMPLACFWLNIRRR